MLVDYDGQAITAVEAYELALKGSTTLACTEFGDWMVHVDWKGQPSFPFSIYVWQGGAWTETGWAATKAEALRRYVWTVTRLLVRGPAAVPQPQRVPSVTGDSR